MKRVVKRILILLLICAAFGANLLTATVDSRKPNIVIVITDDQGYGDLGSRGNPIIKTPNLDKLHDEAIRLTNFHVSTTCAPSRGSLMTGRHAYCLADPKKKSLKFSQDGTHFEVNVPKRIRQPRVTVAVLEIEEESARVVDETLQQE